MPATQPPPASFVRLTPVARATAGSGRVFTALDAIGPILPLTALEGALFALMALPGTVDDLLRTATFSRDGYVRRLLHAGVGYEALLLSWLPGQKTLIHDHGGSVGAAAVLAGRFSERDYVIGADGLATFRAVRTFGAGSIAGADEEDVHVVGNAETDTRLVTIHLYAPKIENMRTFSERPAVVSHG